MQLIKYLFLTCTGHRNLLQFFTVILKLFSGKKCHTHVVTTLYRVHILFLSLETPHFFLLFVVRGGGACILFSLSIHSTY